MPVLRNKTLLFFVIALIVILSSLVVFLAARSTKETKEIKSQAKAPSIPSVSLEKVAPLSLEAGTRPDSKPLATYVLPQEAGTTQTVGSETRLGFSPKPSLNGFSENLFSGSVNASLPIGTPPSSGGFGPSVGLSYSSTSVDDSHLGLNNWQSYFQTQTSWAGQGWDVSGLGSISVAARFNDPALNQYRLSFPGGSFELYPDKTGGTNQWKTNPDSKITVLHTICHAFDVDDYCSWEVRIQDGTTYTFGDGPATYNGGPRDIFPNGATTVSTQKAKNDRGEDASIWAVTRWSLTKVKDIHGNVIEVSYQKIPRDLTSTCQNYPVDWRPTYDRAVYPKEINWSNNEKTGQDFRFKILFNRSPRDDVAYETAGNPESGWKDQDSCIQTYYGEEKLDNIEVKIFNNGDWRLYKKYQLGYEYKTTGSYGQKVNLLLTSFQPLDINGNSDTSLPGYAFTYEGTNSQAQYLKTIDNGYNGTVTYTYEDTPNIILSCQKGGGCYADFPPTVKRVTEKKIENGQGQTQRIVYDYSGSTARAITKEIHNPDCGEPERPTYCGDHRHSIACSSSFDNYEFLGFDKASVLSYDYSGNLLTKATNYYYQLNTDSNCGCGTGGRLEPCAMVHPARGRSYQTQLYDNNNNLVKESNSTFLPANLSSFCDYYTYDNLPFVAEKESLSYTVNPANANEKIITKLENDNLDDHGHFRKTIDWGEVDGSGADVVPNDTRMTWTNYLWNDSYKIGKPESIEVYQGSQRQTTNLLNLVYSQYKEINPGGPALGDPIASHTFLWTDPPANLPTPDNPQGTTLITTRADFDDYGNRRSVTDAENHTTRTDYDNFYNARIVKVTDPYGDTVENRYGDPGSVYQILGIPKEVIDQNHQVTSYEFDSFGRLKNQTNPADQGGQPTQKILYSKDSSGRYIVTSQVRKDQGGTNPASYVSSSSFSNGLGESIQIQTEGDNRLIVADTKYNAHGKVEKQTLAWEGNLAQAGSYQNPNWSKVTTTTYDLFGRPRVVTNPDGTTAETVYDDFQRTITTFDALRHKAVSYADVRGNTIRVEGYTETGNYQLYSATTSLYDTQGRLTNITDNNGNQTYIVYDSLDRVRENTGPDLGKWLYSEYDKNGNLLLQQDARGKRIRFEYDALNRLTKKTWLDEGNKVFTFDYGHTGGETSNNRIGRLWRRIDPNGNFWEATNYDVNGRLTNEKYHLYGQDYPFFYSYDAQNRMTNLTYPDNEQLSYIYSNQGLLKVSSQTNGNVFVNNRTYSVDSQLTYEDVSSDIKKRYTYRLDNLRLTSASTERKGTSLFHFAYDYDLLGNIKTLEDGGFPTYFTYDDFSRLTKASGLDTYNASYTYDSIGNLLTKKEGEENLTLTYNQSQPVHAPKSVNGQQLDYDQVGNLKSWLSEGFNKIDWNTGNKPTRVEKTNGRIVSFEYDGSGNLAKKEFDRGKDVGKETTVYIGNYLEKKTSVIYGKTTTETTKYYFAGAERVALRRDGGQSPGLYFIHTDHLGSLSRITPEGDKPFQFLGQDYYPYGSVRTGHKPYYITDKFFTGQTRDEETGLDYFRARFYSPKLGRFISADTAQGANRYAYADNNPMNIIDPAGHQGWYFGLANLFTQGGAAGKLGGALTSLLGAYTMVASQVARVTHVAETYEQAMYEGSQMGIPIENYSSQWGYMGFSGLAGWGAKPRDTSGEGLLTEPLNPEVVYESMEATGAYLMLGGVGLYEAGAFSEYIGLKMKQTAPAFGIVANSNTDDELALKSQATGNNLTRAEMEENYRNAKTGREKAKWAEAIIEDIKKDNQFFEDIDRDYQEYHMWAQRRRIFSGEPECGTMPDHIEIHDDGTIEVVLHD